MPTFADITDPLLSTYLPVPVAAEGMCDICHRPTTPGFSRCFSCSSSAGQVSHPVDLVVPVTYCEAGGQLHLSLRSYKDSPIESVRRRFATEVAALFGRFMARHAECIAEATGRPWSHIVPVPSGHGRPGQHPIFGALQLLRHPPGILLDALRIGESTLDHQQARDDAFTVTADVTDLSVLVVDDTWTSGASVQSAASALHLAGARVVAAVPIARYIDPAFNAAVQGPLVDRLGRMGFTFDTCCLEDQNS